MSSKTKTSSLTSFFVYTDTSPPSPSLPPLPYPAHPSPHSLSLNTELHPPDAPVNGGLLIGAPPPDIPNLTTKRQRRPSVRLGDIGDHQPSPLSYEPYKRTTTSTTNRLWSSDSKFHHNNHYSPSTTTTTTGTAGGKSSNQETLEIEEKNCKRAKRGGTKRVRSNWYKGLDDESEPKQSPNHSQENVVKEEEEEEEGLFLRKPVIRADHSGAVELDTDLKDWNCRTSVDGNNGGSGDRGRELEDGVRMWLNGIGLGRYEPVFEVHEVDEEVLPLLTLDDLKDMGINAVGSRRKLYCAIQKLGKGFS